MDNRINVDIPPDGRKTDYIQFGGLYRNVLLHVTDSLHVTFPWEDAHAGVRLNLPTVSEQEAVVQAECAVINESPRAYRCIVTTEIRDRDGKLVKTMRDERQMESGSRAIFTQHSEPIVRPHLWSPDDPYLYKVTTIVREGGRETDRLNTSLGIRWVKFDREKGFFLNGRRVKLIGANVHQTWPFIGNAVPDGLHRRDAEQIKATGVNWVRLSHYPHAPAFLDALDELGLWPWKNRRPGWTPALRNGWTTSRLRFAA